MNETIQATLNALITAIIPLLTPFLCAWIAQNFLVLRGKAKDEKQKKYIDIAQDAVITAVESVSQSYVSSLKKSGTFDAKAQEEAFIKSKRAAMDIMSPIAKKVVEEVYGDLSTWLDHKIEQNVKLTK